MTQPAQNNDLVFNQTTCSSTLIVSNRSYFLKRLLDLTITLLAMPFIILFSIIIALLIKIDSKGPVIFTQKRVGINGKIFNCYKFRTMLVGADEQKSNLIHLNEIKGPMFKIKNDPRITKIGKYLRKYSLDEIPQFLNVITNEMSLVGPRPPTVDEYFEYNTVEKNRLLVKPGLSGSWQVYGRSKATKFEEILEYDLEYIKNSNFLLDIKIVLLTVKAVFTGSGY